MTIARLNIVKVKVLVYVVCYPCFHMFSRLSLHPGKVLPQGRNQHMLIQPWICAPGIHHGWVARGSVDSKLAQHFYTWTPSGIEPINYEFLEYPDSDMCIYLSVAHIVFIY